MIFIIGLVLGAVVVLFVLQNIIPITVTFFAWQFHGTLAFILLLAILAGMLISALLSIPELIKKEMQYSHLKKHNKKLEEELETHKQLLNDTQSKIAHIQTPETPVQATITTTETTVHTVSPTVPVDPTIDI